MVEPDTSMREAVAWTCGVGARARSARGPQLMLQVVLCLQGVSVSEAVMAQAPAVPERPASQSDPAPPVPVPASSVEPSGEPSAEPPGVDGRSSESPTLDEPASLGTVQLVLGLTYIATPLLVGLVAAATESPTALVLVAAPGVVHFGYGDTLGGVVATLGYPLSALAGIYVGASVSQTGCRGELFCGVGGAIAGLAVAIIVWPLLDVFAITPALRSERDGTSAERARRVAFSVHPLLDGGGAVLTMTGRL